MIDYDLLTTSFYSTSYGMLQALGYVFVKSLCVVNSVMMC